MQTGLTDSTLTRAGVHNLVVQANEYTFDAVGNLRSRLRHSLLSTPLSHDPDTLRTWLNINGVVRDVKKQTFQYDALNRLTHISHNNSAFTPWVSYAINGNITWKRDKGWYCYGAAGPHAVSGIRLTEGDTCPATPWQYDTWGNLTGDGARTIEYSDFDKATSVTVTATGDTTTFAYGTDRRRYKREDITADGTTRTLYFGSQERVYRLENSVWVLEKTRRNLPGAIQPLHATTGVAGTFYQHKDHLGSVNTLTNDRGEIVQKLYFDAWGKKVALPKTSWQWQAQAAAAPTLKDLDAVTPRGFTGHEHLDHADIIHMNGRIYDPTLGRFLQADPHIQAPNNSQSYNRYSYVLNNPLSYTDPSGYFFKSLFKGIKKYWRVIVAAVATVITYGAASSWAAGWAATAFGAGTTAAAVAGGALAGGIAGFVGGAIGTGSLKGALNGAFSGAVFGGLGGYFKAAKIGDFTQIASHAVAGGILSDLQGGNFGHGFFTAGIMKGFGKIDFDGINVYGRTIIQAIVGGTVSRVTGGKFANGAITSTIQFVVNEKSGWIQKQWDGIKKAFSIIGQEGPKFVEQQKEQLNYELIEEKRLVRALNETSRWSGHGASACAVALQVECAGPLGALSIVTGASAAGLDLLLYDNDTAPIGLIAEGVSDYAQQGMRNMLPAPMRAPVDIAFELQQTITRETIYHVGQEPQF